MISFDPTDDEQAIRDEVRRFAEKELRPRGRDCERARAVPDDLRASYASLGLASLEWPEAAGGAGLALTARVLVEEELAWGDAGLAYALDETGPAAAAILEAAPEAERADLLRSLGSGVTALALSERDQAADVGLSLATSAVEDAGALLVSGRKLFVLHAPRASRWLVLARRGGRADLVLVEGEQGVAREREDDRGGLQALRSSEVVFVHARGRPLAPVAAEGAALDRALARLWLTVAARQVGVARAALEYATFYAQDRSAFGKKIGQFQGIAFKVADTAIAVDAARWLVWKAAVALEKREPGAPREVALALAQANEAAVAAAIDGVQVLGGAGFMEDYPAEKWMREARAASALFGTDRARATFAQERLLGPSIETEPPSSSGDVLEDPSSSDEAIAAMTALARAFGAGG